MADLGEAVVGFLTQLDHAALSPAVTTKVRSALAAANDATSTLHSLARLLAADDAELCDAICAAFRPFLLELAARLLTMSDFDDNKHERLSLTFARVLQVTPRIWPLVQPWLESSRCFFHHMETMSVSRKRRAATTARLLASVQLDTILSMWNWAPFYALCADADLVVRGEAMRATSLLLRMDNATRDAFLSRMESAAMPTSTPRPTHLSQTTTNQVSGAPLPSTLTDICGILVPFRATKHESAYPALIETPSTVSALRSLAIALSLRRPLLVSGADGAGKTAILRELAQRTGHSDLVELHLDDQMDSKTLLGSYVCTDVPGEFTWQPGALTQAVTEGRWVLIEDIDRASMDVLAALLPLLTTQELLVRGHRVPAAPGFQLLATSRKPISAMPKGFPLSLWHRIPVVPMHMDEIALVVAKQFPQLPAHVTDLILGTFTLVTNESSAVWRAARQSYGRGFSLRDVLKWCTRVIKLHGHIEPGQYLTQAMRDDLAREAWDIFCMGIRDMDARVAAAISIGALWQVQPEVVETQLRDHRPTFVPHHASVTVGRVQLQALSQSSTTGHQIPFVLTGHCLRLMEQLAATVATFEPTLLVGETGCGKTTLIQYLASAMGQTLVVQNLNVQSDSADLLGGYKPVDVYQLARPLYMDFVNLFSSTFPSSANASFLHAIQKAFSAKQYKKMTQGMTKAIAMADAKAKKMKLDESALTWAQFGSALAKFQRQYQQVESSFAFSFVEGMLVQAMKAGHWILLDEINLAGADTLERLASVLEGEHSGLSLTERGDVDVLKPHPNFRVFAAMNPPTDVGKKDLPPSLRNRFTQVYVDECVCPRDLTLLVSQQWKEMVNAPVAETVNFYLSARQMAIEVLNDGARQRPRYSLRTLTRSLLMTKTMLQRGYSLPRALYESFSMGFATQLDAMSRTIMMKTIKKTFAPNIKTKELDQAPPKPRKSGDTFELVSSYWVPKGELTPVDDAIPDPVTNLKKFVLTPSVEQNLRHVARSVVVGKYPLLLQGPTSAGKTSLILYVAARLGQKCVRINNHEHTDIQEYLGAYVSDSDGKLTFQEGVLVQAVRHGWWIILDELNLAPSEVLEALNRLLDDNRELYVPETQTTITPHPRFMLFATQNPPGLYGGRKVLSRAFRNRFIELQVDEVPANELQMILQERSALPPSYCNLLIEIMLDLQRVRAQSSVFAGKAGFITTRDLLRWAQRAPTTKQRVAEEGYFLLAERLRKDEDKLVVQQVLEKRCGVTIDLDALYNGVAVPTNVIGDTPATVWGTPEQFAQVQAKLNDVDAKGNHSGLSSISITSSLRRLFALVGRCLQHKEPILLVGDTGCGKTTVCQLYSLLFDQTLHILNCHQHTETADFLGSLRPVRAKEQVLRQLTVALAQLDAHVVASYPETLDTAVLRADLNLATIGGVLDGLLPKVLALNADDTVLLELHATIQSLKAKAVALFEWVDGPLVSSMKAGDLLLVDEINLADDAVLERLNSVLEPSRGLVLAEKGDTAEHITAAEPWRILATMNPGGDFGKRELSPALRNRFTEIWVPSLSRLDDLQIVIRDRLPGPSAHLADPVLTFVQQFNAKFTSNGWKVTLRDLLSWLDFVNASDLDPALAYVQGAALAVLDGLGLGSTQSLHAATTARSAAYDMLSAALPSAPMVQASMDWVDDGAICGVSPFMIAKGPEPVTPQPFSLAAPTTLGNLHRVLRALQVPRPILLEGSPGVGKTSLIHALAQLSGHTLVRINLSEQTDVADLFGSDLPSTDANASSPFSWCDGVFLRALKAGHWVLLDELNLASQSVLEGLNACLDHRGTVYIPEIDQSFACPKTFRVFAAQNPLRQGGGRKGLPKSFLNRFTRVVVDSLHETDLRVIATALYPSIPAHDVHKMIAFNSEVHHETMVACSFGRHGAPWEFNLRDVFRWCTLVEKFQAPPYDVSAFIPMLYGSRFRSHADRTIIEAKRAAAFGPSAPAPPVFQLTPTYLQVGTAILPRVHAVLPNLDALPPLLNQWLEPMQALMHCLHLQWPALLVGPSGSGKTAIVRLLAAMTGRKLHELGLSTGTDATELLGCFEQVDVQRRVQEAMRELDDVVAVVQQKLLLATKTTEFNAVTQAVAAVHQRQAAWKAHKGEMDPMLLDLLDHVVSVLTPHAPSPDGIASIHAQLLSIRTLVASPARSSCFEWVDGALLRAMELGDWLLLDNVNFCSASVLDRLNSLLEINGELLVNECGVVNGNLRVVKPHKNFRIFLAMDAQFGEVSRAMRNRCIEIALVPNDMASSPKMDFVSLVQGAATSVAYPVAVYDRLHAVHFDKASLDKSISMRHVVNWSQLVQALVDHGVAFSEALELATHDVYGTTFGSIEIGADHGTAAVSTQMLVQDAVRGMGARDARLPVYLASSPSQLIEWVQLWTTATVSDKWPRHLLLNDEAVWAQCATAGLQDATTAMATHLLPWALYRSGQPSGFHAPSAHPFGTWLGSEVLLQSILNGLSSAITTCAAVAAPHLSSLVVNPPALHVLKTALLQAASDAASVDAQWQPVDALVQSLEMLQHMWWPRFQEQVLLGLATTEVTTAAKKTKRALKKTTKKAAATLLNVSYECFLHGADSVDVENDLIPIVYPTLHALDAVVDEFVQLSMYKLLSARHVADVAKVIDLRYALGRVFSSASSVFPWHPFLVVWKWLVKAFNDLETHVLTLSTAVVHAKDMLERMEFGITTCMGVARSKDTLWKRGGHRQLPPSLTTWSAISAVEGLAATATGPLTAAGHQQQVSLLDMLCTTSSVYEFTPSSLLSVPYAFRQELLHALTTYAWFIETANESFATLQQLPKTLSASYDAMQAKFAAEHKHMLVHLTPPDDDMDRGETKTVLLLADDNSKVVEMWIQLQLSPLRELLYLRLEHQIVALLSELLVAPLASFAAKVPVVLCCIDKWLPLQRFVPTRSPVTLVPYQDVLWRGHVYVDATKAPTLADHIEFKRVVTKHLQSIFVSFHDRLWNSSIVHADKISNRVYHTESQEAALTSTGGLLRLHQAVETTLALHYLQPLKQTPIVDVTAATAKLQQAVAHWLEHHECPNLDATSGAYWWHLLSATVLVFVPTAHDALAVYAASGDASPLLALLATSKDARFVASLPILRACLVLSARLPRGSMRQQGVQWTLLGLWRFGLLTPTSPLDPALLPLIKRDVLLQQIARASCRHTVDTVLQAQSPQAYAAENVDASIAKVEALTDKAIARPCDDALFGAAFQEIVRFGSTIMTAKVVGWCEALATHATDSSQVLRELIMFQQTTESFVRRLQHKYVVFEDVIEPVVAAIYHAKDGLSLLMSVVTAQDKPAISSLARTLLSVPSPASLPTTASALLDHGAVLDAHHVPRLHRLTTALYQLELQNTDQLQLFRRKSASNGAYLAVAQSIFDGYMTLWTENQAKMDKKREEDEQLFRFKARTLEIDSEEQILEREYRQQFPDFAKAFSDLLEDPLVATPADADPTIDAAPLPDAVVQLVSFAHERLFTQHTRYTTSRAAAVQAMYEVGFHLKASINDLRDEVLDVSTRGGHIVYAQQSLAQQAPASNVVFSQLSAAYVAGIDFHKDAHVKEVVMVRSPLQRFMLRVRTLLEQWPDNAILQKLLLLANRLRQMSMHVPLAQILVGVELLLKNAQDWQAIASRDVAITDEIASLSGLVVRWRKLELYSWPQLMLIKERKFQLEARKAWFHLYTLLTSPPSGDETVVPEVATLDWMFTLTSMPDTEVLAKGWRFQLFDTMDAFLRTCTVGQFQTRLVLLYAFCGQLFLEVQHAPKLETLRLASTLYHLYRFYAQHLTYGCHPLWSRLRTPIQTQLNDFIKISRWDEQTYYSLAASAEKSHRKLMKFVRDYEEILNMPMQTFIDKVVDGNITNEKYDGIQALQTTWNDLKARDDPVELVKDTEKDDDANDAPMDDKDDDDDEGDAPKEVWRVVAMPTKTKEAPVVLPEAWTAAVDSYRWVAQLPTLTRKIQKYTATELLTDAALRRNQAGRHVGEDICETIIYRIEKLKSDSAPKGAKKKALVDLLAEIKSQGFSHLKTKTPPQQQHMQSLLELDVPFVDTVLRLHPEVVATAPSGVDGLWAHADSYYYRFLSQIQSMRFTVASGYNKDISWSEVDRMSGYAENMLHTMLQQRALLAQMASTHEGLLFGLAQLQSLPSSHDLVHAQTFLASWRDAQTATLLQLTKWVDELLLLFADDPVLGQLLTALQQCGAQVAKASVAAHSGIPEVPSDDGNFDAATSFGFQDKTPSTTTGFSPHWLEQPGALWLDPAPLLASAAGAEAVVAQLAAFCSAKSVVSIRNALSSLASEQAQWAADAASHRAPATTNSLDLVEAVGGRFNTVVESILLSIQQACSLFETKSDDDKVDLESMVACHQHLAKVVGQSQVHKIPEQLLSLLSHLHASSSADVAPCLRWVQSLVPALSALVQWHFQFLSDVIYVHKSMSKAEFVMVRVFRTLLSNGFCKAPEEKEDDSTGGQFNFEDDVEGTGMGEGDGKKDVSDQIEDEEQLLGLKGDEPPPENQEKKDKEKDDSGLEMNNDFDGQLEDLDDDDQKDDDKDDDDDQEELDREMGDFDEDNIVDEKRWGEDSDDEDDNIDKDKEKFDDKEMEGEALEDEVRGKDGDEDEDEKNDKDEKDDKKDKPQPPAADDANDDDDDGEDDGEDKKDGPMPDDEINEDTEDKYEEDHDDLAPRDANPDDEESKPEEEEFAEDMKLDGDGDDDDKDDDEPIDEEMPNDESPEGEGAEDESAAPEDEEPEEDADAPEPVSMGAGMDDQDVPDEQKDDESKLEEEVPEEIMPEEKKDESQNAGAVAGLESKDGADTMEPEETKEDDDEKADEDMGEAEDSAEQNQDRQGGQANPEGKDLQSVHSDASADPQSRERKDPNPYQNPRKAQEHWRKRMEILDSDTTKDQTTDENDDDDGADDKKDDGGVGELADDDKKAELALAPTEDTVMHGADDDEDKDGDKPDEPMDDDETPVPEETPVVEDKPTEAQDEEKAPKAPQDKMQKAKEQGLKAEELVDDDADDDMGVDDDDDVRNDFERRIDEEVDEFAPIVASGADAGGESGLDATTSFDVDALRAQLDAAMSCPTVDSIERGTALWNTYDHITRAGAQRLCEQLRLVLAPMLRSRLQGDYRTGKRINMRKVIPYIASSFRKDKIWLRRTKPSKRAYQVMVAIDDSESMADNHAGRLALEALTTLCKGMTQLEVGDISVVKFGAAVELLHPFDMPFTDDAGGRVIRSFQFDQTKTHMVQTLEAIVGLLDQAKASSHHSGSEITQIVFMISDGRFDKDGRTRMQKLVQHAMEKQQLIVLLIVDHPKDGQGICDTQSVSFVRGKVEMTPYMDNFPFPYYVIMKDTTLLPETLCNALRQWFELLQGSD